MIVCTVMHNCLSSGSLSLHHLGGITKGCSKNLSVRIFRYIFIFINTKQLYSNLVILIKYYLSVPCVGCPCVSKDLQGQACLAMYCSTGLSLYIYQNQHHHAQLSKCFPFIDLGRQRRTNTWSLKQRVSSA